MCSNVHGTRFRTEDGGQRLGGLEEVQGGNGILLVGVDGDVDEGLAESLDDGLAGGDDGGGHGCGGVMSCLVTRTILVV